jgi:predicted phage terminase large subunit-like protein
VWVDALVDLVEKHKPTRVFGERGVIKNMIEPFLTKRMRERGVYFTHEWITRVRDKETSAQAFRGKCSMGHIHFPENSNWAERVIAQLVSFPAGKFDDAVDVCSLLGLALDQLQKPSKPYQPYQWRRRRRVSAWTR